MRTPARIHIRCPYCEHINYVRFVDDGAAREIITCDSQKGCGKLFAASICLEPLVDVYKLVPHGYLSGDGPGCSIDEKDKKDWQT